MIRTARCIRAAWVKTAKNGSKFLSIKATDKFQPKQRESAPQTAPAEDFDDSLPF